MRRPWQTRARVPDSGPDIPAPDGIPHPEIHRSPGLEAALAGLLHGHPIRVLDLGPAVPENVDYFAGCASRIQVVDALRGTTDAVPATTLLRGLATDHERSYHLVLLWDCLNYLSPAQGADLVESVLPLCRPDAHCLAMVVGSDTMPAAPTRFRIVDECHLTYERSTAEMVGAPQMTPAAVQELLGGFSIEHSFVLRNGVREYVAVFDAAGKETLKR